jgi:HEAT repeat protein/putative zinc finger protein
MKCDWVKENLAFYVYDELPDDARFEFMHHIQHCANCKQELEAMQVFKSDMAAAPEPEVSPNFLASSRMQLQEALEHAHQNRSVFGSFIFDFAGWMHQIKLAPALTAALLMIGFAGGTITTWRIAEHRPQISDQKPGGPDVNIAGIESVVTDTNSNKVTITYDTLRPQTYVSTPDDPRVQELLLLGTKKRSNSDVRLGSIGILKDQAQEDKVRDVLVSSLRFDANPGVRLSALAALKSYVRDDVRVRDAVLEALLHDNNPGVRQAAIGLLDPVKADTAVREALRNLATRDQDQYIRTQSQKYLESTPHLD